MFYEWHKASISFFYLSELSYCPKISTRENLTNINFLTNSAQSGIIATTFKAAEIYFISDAFATIFVMDVLKATVPNNISWRVLIQHVLKVGYSVGKEVLRRKMRRKNAKYRVDKRELVYMYRLELVQRLFGNVGHPEFINLHVACAN